MKNYEIPLVPGTYYHVFNHANGRDNLFANRGNYQFFLQRYAFFMNPIVDTYAYCLLPNHLHFLVRIKEEHELKIAWGVKNKPYNSVTKEVNWSAFISRAFGNLYSSYSQAFNRQQNRMGSLFMPNFKRREVDNEDYLVQLIHYIHANPVHHGFVNSMDRWEFSSYHALKSVKPTKLKRDEVLEYFGGVNEFVQFHNQMPISKKCLDEGEF
ncbi:MAG TPA: hypothetical protein DCM71_09915 [Runella sp.]|nr:hypothetical protein [Runella sp.]